MAGRGGRPVRNKGRKNCYDHTSAVVGFCQTDH